MLEEVNSTMIYCKSFPKCHNVSPVQIIYNNEKVNFKKPNVWKLEWYTFEWPVGHKRNQRGHLFEFGEGYERE
jgi:hypothetical protein